MRLDQYRVYQAWDLFIALSVAFAAVEIPLRLVLGDIRSLGMTALDGAIPFILALDVLAQWYRPEPGQQHAIFSSRMASARVAWLSLDLLAALPFKLLTSATILPLVHLVKLARVAQHMRHWRHHAVQHANVLRLAFFIYWLLLTAHWLACGWLALGGNTTLANQVAVDGYRRYLRALYWSVTTLSTIGYGDLTPQTDAQIAFTMVAMFLGVAIYGYVIGNVTSLLANIDLARRHYLENMERLGAFMRYRNIPPLLQRRLRGYYAHLWENQLGGYDESGILTDLPESLRIEVALRLNGLTPADVTVELLLSRAGLHGKEETISNVFVAQGADAGGEHQYVLELAPELCGRLDMHIRAYPCHGYLTHPLELGLMIWA